MGAKRRKYFLNEGKISLVRWNKMRTNKLLDFDTKVLEDLDKCHFVKI